MNTKQPDERQKRKKRVENADFKIILVGESDVGKTTLIKMFTNGQVDSLRKDVTDVCNNWKFTQPIEMEDGQKVVVKGSVWDTAGAESFKNIAGMYYAGVHAAIIMYAIDNNYSF